MSAQDTLAEATALLTELNTRDEDDDEDDEVMEGETTPKMEINGSSEGSEVNGNGDGDKPRQPVENEEEGDLEDIDTWLSHNCFDMDIENRKRGVTWSIQS